MTHQDMSHTCHMRHIFTPGDQTIKNNFAHNRILSKVQKSFWSCTHVNSCQNYALYVNIHILLNILIKTTLDIQESTKFIKRLKR